MGASAGGWLASQRKNLLWILAIDAVVVALVLGATLASGGFDGGVIAGGLAIALFLALMVWFYVGLRAAGYRTWDRIYDSEFHAIQTDQQLQQPRPIEPRRMPRGVHLTMAGVVVSLVVLMFVFRGL